MSELDKKITKARVQLVLHEPFFGTLVLNTIPTPTDKTPVAATDGLHFYYNPEVFEKLGLEEIKFICAHEAMHCAFEHAKRKGNRDHGLWNCAGDYVINLALTDAGFRIPKIPPDILEKWIKQGGKFENDNLLIHDEKHRGKNADVVYTELFNSKKDLKSGTCVLICKDSKTGKKNKGGCDDGGTGIGKELGADKEGGKEERSPDWPVILAQAAHKARMRGKLPAHMEELIKEMLNPKIPWYEKLRQYLTKFTKEEPRWIPPNKKFIHRRIYLPSIRGETAELVIGVDTSGSVGTDELEQFYGEIDSIRRTCRMKIHVVYCDAAVHKVDTLDPWDDLKFTPIGRGGTDFRPVFKEIEKRGIEPDACVFMTDGDGAFPSETPEYPVLWVLSKGKRKIPFGDVIIIED